MSLIADKDAGKIEGALISKQIYEEMKMKPPGAEDFFNWDWKIDRFNKQRMEAQFINDEWLNGKPKLLG